MRPAPMFFIGVLLCFSTNVEAGSCHYVYGARIVEVSSEGPTITIRANAMKSYFDKYLSGKNKSVNFGEASEGTSPALLKIKDKIQSGEDSALLRLDLTNLEGWFGFDALPYGVRLLSMDCILKITPEYESAMRSILVGRGWEIVSGGAAKYGEEAFNDAYAYQQALQFVLDKDHPRAVLSGTTNEQLVREIGKKASESALTSYLTRTDDIYAEFTGPVYLITHQDQFYDGEHRYSERLQKHASRLQEVGIPTVMLLHGREGWYDDISINANIDVPGAKEMNLGDGSHLFRLKTNDVFISGNYFGNCASRTGLYSLISMFKNGVPPPYKINYFADTLVGGFGDELHKGPTLHDFLSSGGLTSFVKHVENNDKYAFFLEDFSKFTQKKTNLKLFVDGKMVLEHLFGADLSSSDKPVPVEYYMWDQVDPPSLRE